jgi:hypothetical protein
MGRQKQEKIEQYGKHYVETAENLQKRSIFTIHIIGQRPQLTKHKIRVRLDSVYILELDFFCSLDVFAPHSNYQKF